jgi:hypothetical protein
MVAGFRRSPPPVFSCPAPPGRHGARPSRHPRQPDRGGTGPAHGGGANHGCRRMREVRHAAGQPLALLAFLVLPPGLGRARRLARRAACDRPASWRRSWRCSTCRDSASSAGSRCARGGLAAWRPPPRGADAAVDGREHRHPRTSTPSLGAHRLRVIERPPLPGTPRLPLRVREPEVPTPLALRLLAHDRPFTTTDASRGGHPPTIRTPRPPHELQGLRCTIPVLRHRLHHSRCAIRLTTAPPSGAG